MHPHFQLVLRNHIVVSMNLSLYFFSFLIMINALTATRERNIVALTEEEYDIMVRKIAGQYNKGMADRTLIEKSTIRKYYRWLKQGKHVYLGPSGKTIYIRGDSQFEGCYR